MESNAAEQLAAIAESRAAVADRLVTPWWYHPALGLLLALYVVGVSFGDTIGRFVLAGLMIAAAYVLGRIYRRHTGVWISGIGGTGRARFWAVGLGVLVGAVAVAGILVAGTTDLVWPVWALAGVAFVGVIVLGRRFDAALRAHLRGEA